MGQGDIIDEISDRVLHRGIGRCHATHDDTGLDGTLFNLNIWNMFANDGKIVFGRAFDLIAFKVGDAKGGVLQVFAPVTSFDLNRGKGDTGFRFGFIRCGWCVCFLSKCCLAEKCDHRNSRQKPDSPALHVL